MMVFSIITLMMFTLFQKDQLLQVLVQIQTLLIWEPMSISLSMQMLTELKILLITVRPFQIQIK